MVEPATDPRLPSARQWLIDTLGARVELDAPAEARVFVQRLLVLSDRSVRTAAVRVRLARLDHRFCLALLQALVDDARRRDTGAQEVLLDLTTSRPLTDALGYERSRDLYELAQRRDQRQVAALFISPDVAEDARSGPGADADNLQMPDTSLGWRKALARGTNRLKLDRLLWDRDPAVIGVLLNNPRLLERDVVKIAAMRPANPEVLDVVFRHPRWISRYQVKSALALNPSTPVDIAVTLLSWLQLPQLRYAARSQRLHARVRERAAEILRERRERADVPDAALLRLSAVEEDDEGLDLERLAAALEDWSAPEGAV